MTNIVPIPAQVWAHQLKVNDPSTKTTYWTGAYSWITPDQTGYDIDAATAGFAAWETLTNSLTNGSALLQLQFNTQFPDNPALAGVIINATREYDGWDDINAELAALGLINPPAGTTAGDPGDTGTPPITNAVVADTGTDASTTTDSTPDATPPPASS